MRLFGSTGKIHDSGSRYNYQPRQLEDHRQPLLHRVLHLQQRGGRPSKNHWGICILQQGKATFHLLTAENHSAIRETNCHLHQTTGHALQRTAYGRSQKRTDSRSGQKENGVYANAFRFLEAGQLQHRLQYRRTDYPCCTHDGFRRRKSHLPHPEQDGNEKRGKAIYVCQHVAGKSIAEISAPSR